MTGGVHKAASGEITVLVGGDLALFEAHRPAFDAMGGKVLHVGPLGSASVIKVITNMLAFVHLVAVGEALMLAKRGGIDLAKAFEAIRGELRQQLRARDREPGDPLGQLRHRLHHRPRVQGPGPRAPARRAPSACRSSSRAWSSRSSCARARSYGGSAWSPMVVKLLEDALGTELRAPGFPISLQPADAGR